MSELSNYQQYLVYRRPPSFKFFTVDKKLCWIKDKKTKVYVLTEIVNDSDPDVVMLLNTDSGEELIVERDEIFMLNPSKFDGVEDCAQLPHLSEASVLYNLKLRYDANVIYTYSGLFCVVINPYRLFPIYTPDIIKMYKNKRREELSPHVYAVADGAYRCLLNDHNSQSMLVTGESGAGKTENTKKIIQYLAAVAGKSGDEGELERQLLQANPLLEALGNAKTLKNNNSSRFGKFIRITFGKNGFISGGSVVSYLLERSRVVYQGKLERNFHIFYQMCDGLPHAKKQDLFITQPEDFAYISNSGCIQVDGMDDAREFVSTMDALKILNFSDFEITTILKICSGILHLGNIKFEGDEIAKIVNPDSLTKAAELFGIKIDVLQNAILKPRITVQSEVIAKNLNPTKASQSRDALAKALYGRMFLWVVDKINQTLKVKEGDLFIGILDIAGFEIFEHNSFEQLCINFTNERLQQFFNNHMFSIEQEEYIREKIEWKIINFGIDSQATIDLISKTGRGLLSMLDDECLVPNGTDKAYAQKVVKAYLGKHPKFSQNKLASETSFNIEHYAGTVTYDTNEWCEKNKDPLENDLESAVSTSTNIVLAKFFRNFASDKTAQSEQSKIRATTTRKKGAPFNTVGSQYKEQLDSLLETLGTTRPHFVRCIIPNHRKVPGEIDDEIVIDQLACNGVLEGIKISRMGYPNRMPYRDFHKRYYMLGDILPSLPDSKAATRTIIEKLINKSIIHADRLQFGVGKIFFRVGEMASIEEAREKFLATLIPDIQACIRGYIGRKIYLRKLDRINAAITIQEYIREYIALQEWDWFVLFQKVRSSLQIYTWEMEAQKHKQKIEELNIEVNKIIDEKTKLWEEAEFIETDINDIKLKLKQQNEDYEELNNELQLLEEQKQKQRQNILDDEDELSKKINDIKMLESSRDILELEIIHVEKTGGDFTQINAKIEKEVQVLQEKLLRSKAELEKVLEENDDLTKENERLQRELDPLLDEIEDKRVTSDVLKKTQIRSENDFDDLNDEFEFYIKEVSALKTQISVLDPEIEKITNILKTLTSEHSEVESECKFFQLEIDKMVIEVEASVRKKGDLEKEIKNLELEREEKDEDFIDEKKSIENFSRRISALQSDLDLTCDEIKDIQEKNRKLELIKLKLQGELDNLKRLLSESENLALKLEKENKNILKNVDQTTSDLENELYTISVLEKKNQTLSDNISALNERVAKEGGENNKLTKQYANLEAANKKLWHLYSETKTKHVDFDQENKRLVSDLKELRTNIKEISSQNELEISVVQKLEKLSKQLEQSLNDFRQNNSQNNDKIETLTEDLEDLKEDKKKLMEKRDKFLITTKRLDSELKKLTPEYETQRDIRKKLEKEIITISPEVTELVSKEGQLDSENILLERNVSKLTTEHSRLLSNLEDSTRALDSVTKKNTKLNEELQPLKIKLQDITHNITTQQYQLSRVTEALIDSRNEISEKEKQLRANAEVNRSLEAKYTALKDEIEEEKSRKIKSEKKVKDIKLALEGIKENVDSGKLNSLETKQDRLKIEIKTVKSECEREIEERKKLTVINYKHSQSIDYLKSQISDIFAKKDVVEKESEKIRQEIITNKSRVKRLEDANVQLEKDCKQLEKEAYKASQNALHRIDRATEMKNVREEIESYRKVIEKDHLENLAFEKKSRELENLLEKLQQNYEDQRINKEKISSNESENLSKIRELRRQTKLKQDLNSVIRDEIFKQDNRIYDIKHQIREESEKTDQAKQFRDDLLLDLEHTRRSLENEAKKRLEYDRQLRDLNELLKKAKEPLPDLVSQEDDLKDKIKQIKKLRAKWRELDGELETQRELHVNLRIQASTLAKELEMEKHSMKNFLLEIEQLKEDTEDTKVESDAAVYTLKSFNGIVRDLQSELSEIKSQLKKEMSLGDQLEGTNIELDMEAEGIKERIQTQKEAIKVLQQIKKELSEENNDLTKNLSEEKESVENMINQKSKWRSSLMEARIQLESAQIRFAQLEEINRGKDSKQKKISIQLEPLENKKSFGTPREIKIEAKVKKYQALVAHEGERARNATNELKRAKTELLRLREAVMDLKDDLTTTKKKIRQSKDPRRRLTDRIVAMTGSQIVPKYKSQKTPVK